VWLSNYSGHTGIWNRIKAQAGKEDETSLLIAANIAP